MYRPHWETTHLHFAITSKQYIPCHPVFFGVALLLFSHLTPAWALGAENTPASTSFQAAQKSFQAKNYQQALTLFKQARAAGLDKPALFYNIGVCSYKLGLYEEATNAFLHTATFPKMAALAYYNLAVVAEKQNDPDAAISWLEKSQTSAGEQDEKLLLLAQTALARIQSKQGLTDNWIRYVSLGFGYDDNVSMVDSADLELTSDEEDSFTDVMAFVRSPLLGDSATQGPYLLGGLSFRDYTALNEYDTGSLRMEGRYRKKNRGFQLEGAAGYSYVFWDNSGYSHGPLISLQAKHPVGDASSYRLRYEGQHLKMLNSTFDYMRGWQHRTTAEFSTKFKSSGLIIGYSLEANERRDKESSPRRHLISAAVELHLVERLTINVGASYRASTYDIAYSEDRTEDRYEASLLLNYTLSKKWDLRARASRTVNISSSSPYDYSRNLTSISLGYTF